MNQSPNYRLDMFVKHIRITRTELAEKLGTSQPTISAILSGKRTLSRGMIARIGEQFSCLNLDWLQTGEGEMLQTDERGNARFIGGTYIASEGDEAVVMVDYVPVAARASFIENLYQPGATDTDKFPIVVRHGEREAAADLAVFEVEGDSMLPSISSGSLILAKKIPESLWHTAEGVIVIVFAEFVAIKRVERNELQTGGSTISLKSDNAAYPGMTVQLSDIRAIYKAKRKISEEIV